SPTPESRRATSRLVGNRCPIPNPAMATLAPGSMSLRASADESQTLFIRYLLLLEEQGFGVVADEALDQLPVESLVEAHPHGVAKSFDRQGAAGLTQVGCEGGVVRTRNVDVVEQVRHRQPAGQDHVE